MADLGPLTIGIDASRATTPRATGTERYSRRIIEAVTAAGPQHRYRLYLNAAAPVALCVPPTTEQRLIPFPRLWTHLRLSAELARHRVDALFVPAHVIPPVHPRASVVTIHDLGYRYEPEAHTPAARRYLDWSTRWSVRVAARVIAISATTRDDLIRHYGVPAEKIRVIPHGIEPGFTPQPPDVVARWLDELGLRRPYVLFVGTLQPRKNLARLIAAFDRLADDRPELRLVLAGKRGWLAEEIDAALARSPHRDRIDLPGHVPDAALPALYGGAAAFALPSLYEGFGLPVVEAMDSGTQVVVSDRGALPEVGGEAAIVVDPRDPAAIAAGLARALDPAERERRVAAGLAHAARFRWDAAGRATLAAIEEAVAVSRGRHGRA
ncbi:MAG: glycosyltransferase family 1 protein [Sphaerobacter sp.]|nr:glycosyltransferase family 1 protein [Sphaerobacter sp.]